MSILTAPSAFQVPDCWAHREIRRAGTGPVHRVRIDRRVVGIEHIHVHAREVAGILAHMRGNFGLRKSTTGHRPGRVEIDAGDVRGQRRRRFFFRSCRQLTR